MMGPGGLLEKHIPYFRPRMAQQEMAETIAEAIEEHQVLIAEAGTGTGKTFAYLLPAVLSGKKIIISTGTKNLQDQLFHRDIPVMLKALPVSTTVAILKGRANYLCLYRLEHIATSPRHYSERVKSDLSLIRVWSGNTQSGDLAEMTDLSERSPTWPLVTSSTENCLGQECPVFSECFLMKVRRDAQQADILVVNHHLFFADMVLRDEGYGELLPGANGFIFDEAHQLPEIASKFFSLTITSRQLLELANDTLAEKEKDAKNAPELENNIDALQKSVRDLRLAFGIDSRRGAWSEVKAKKDVIENLHRLGETLEQLQDHLKPLAASGKGLEACWKRSVDLSERYRVLTQTMPENYIHWFETHNHGFVFNLTPMDIANLFHNYVGSKNSAWIFTSATLAVGERFDHFKMQLGLEQAVTRQWLSPFDYALQALLYIPNILAEPNDPAYTASVINAALPVIEASRGRTFLLFTSHRALEEAYQRLYSLKSESKFKFPLLVQGRAPRSELLNQFREAGNAVLMGTSSFWEGVDVRGEALSCVIIDKLPFASPGDPIVKARIEAMREQGRNPFHEYQLSHAVITLKQGFGRLIRDVTDRGVMMLCDPRLRSKSYGRVFINSLPKMPLTRDLDDVVNFFNES